MASDISAAQWFSELLENRRQVFFKSKDLAPWRAEREAEIEVAKTIKESTPGIGPKNLAIPSFEEMVDVASRESLRFDLISIVILEEDENAAQEIIEEMVQTTVSYFRETKARGQQIKKSREGKKVDAIITALREQFGCRIDRALNTAEAELCDLHQLLRYIATCPNGDERETARETAVWRCLRAISRAKSEADAALGDFEAERDKVAGIVKISQFHADSAVEELPPSDTGYYTPKDLASHLGTTENNIRGRLSKIVKSERIPEGDLRYGERWEIDNSIVNRVYKILKKKR